MYTMMGLARYSDCTYSSSGRLGGFYSSYNCLPKEIHHIPVLFATSFPWIGLALNVSPRYAYIQQSHIWYV